MEGRCECCGVDTLGDEQIGQRAFRVDSSRTALCQETLW